MQDHSPRAAPNGAAGLSSSWMNSVLALTLGLICIVVGGLLYNARTLAFDQAAIEAGNLSSAITQDIARNVEMFDLSIRGVVEGLADPNVMAAPKKLRRLVLFDRAATAKDLGAILVLDEHGNLIIDSRTQEPPTLNYADREYFKVHAEHSGVGLFVSQPLTSRSDGELIIGFSRRINKPDGSFGGVVVGTLHLDYLRHLFSGIKLGPSGSIALFRTDGSLVMRKPFEPERIGKVLKPVALFDRLPKALEGSYQATSVVDGIERLIHYKQIADLPLVLTVAIATSDIYADWWRKVILIVFIVGLCCGIIVALAERLKRELRRRLAAEAALTVIAQEDALTGLANRRRFDEVLDDEWRIALAHGSPLSLLMIDADRFKAYNDALGHPEGDKALAALGACLRARAPRSRGLAARYGGEEFALILPSTPLEEAVEMAEAIRLDVLDLRMPHPMERVLSVSLGVATLVPDQDHHVADLIEAADRALYASKERGRNRSTSLLDETAPA